MIQSWLITLEFFRNKPFTRCSLTAAISGRIKDRRVLWHTRQLFQVLYYFWFVLSPGWLKGLFWLLGDGLVRPQESSEGFFLASVCPVAGMWRRSFWRGGWWCSQLVGLTPSPCKTRVERGESGARQCAKQFNVTIQKRQKFNWNDIPQF